MINKLHHHHYDHDMLIIIIDVITIVNACRDSDATVGQGDIILEGVLALMISHYHSIKLHLKQRSPIIYCLEKRQS